MDYFFADPEEIVEGHLSIKGDEYRHLSKVLRKKAGDHVMVTDGKGRMYEAIIRSLSRTHAECAVLHTFERLNEPRIEVTLAISPLKNPARLDFAVEKATELGVSTIIPLVCERTIRKHEKHLRLQKLAAAAMKQCGRCVLPTVFILTHFDTLVANSGQYQLKLIPHERTEQSQFIGSVMKHHPEAKSALILIGPEGGFTDEEMRLAADHGFVAISLGPRRLRSETAAISALSWVVGGW